MFGINDFSLFLLTAIALNLTPGPDTFYILGRSVSQGAEAGIASVLGISTGSLVHTLVAALGLSALLATSALAFLLVKIIGAAYLVYLGARMLLSGKFEEKIEKSFPSSGFWTIYKQGLLTNVLNPKVALFFLALVPQFIATESTTKPLAFITLGVCFIATGTIWCLCLAWFASNLSSRVRSNSAFSNLLKKASGILFVFLGIRLATSE